MPPTTSAQFSLTLRVRIDHRPGMLGRVASAIGEAGGTIGNIVLVEASRDHVLRDLTVDARDEAHERGIVAAVRGVEGAEVVAWTDRTLELHVGGKLEVRLKHPLTSVDDLSMAYTPGVARVCSAIAAHPDRAFQFTIKRNTVAVVSDGTAVLGLGDIGPEAAMPVMEGKAMLFKEFADVDAYPICLDCKDTEDIITTIKNIALGFGGINLEDISSPRCFEIEERLQQELDIPVFHDDQHGTAVVVLAALHNALRLVGKELEDLKVVVNGVGASGSACTKILLSDGIKNIIGLDSKGVVHPEREDLSPMERWVAENTNPEGLTGELSDVIAGADLFLGLSVPGVLTTEHLDQMASDPIIFALANPDPEITPEETEGRARIIATGRSDYPNQINNTLCFPGIFRGALDSRARKMNEEMKLAAARALAEVIPEEELSEDYVIPSLFDERIVPTMAEAVAEAARESGSARTSFEQENPMEAPSQA